MTATARQRFDATRAGRRAAEQGKPVTVCPHRVDGSDDDAVLATAWVRGYASHPDTSGNVDYSS